MEDIIKKAKTKESWSVDGRYNYAPIDFLYYKVAQNGGQFTNSGYMTFIENVHKVTDPKTYLVWLYKNYDIFVDCTSMVLEMRSAFPKVPFEQVMAWIEEEREPHHLLNFNSCIAPAEYQNLSIEGIFRAIRNCKE